MAKRTPLRRAQSDRTNLPGRLTSGRGQNEISPVRVRSRRRADLALRLREEGLTYEEIAAFPGEDGVPLYSGRGAAHDAVESAMRRRLTLPGRARFGAQLLAIGLTFEQIAAYPVGEDMTLYSSAAAARRVITTERERRRLVLAGKIPASVEDLVSLAVERVDERASARP